MTENENAKVLEEEPKDGAKRTGFFGAIANMFRGMALFFRQVGAELKKVTFPTRPELIRMTLVVLAFVVLMIVIIWGLDQLFGWVTVLVFG